MDVNTNPVDLTLLGRFKSPYFSYLKELPCEWDFPYDDSNPWRPTSPQPGPYTSLGSKLDISKTENCSNYFYLEDVQGNQYNILGDSNNIVDYYAKYSTYTGTYRGSTQTIPCVDFPWVATNYYFISDIEFIGQGSENGITGINIIRTPFSSYGRKNYPYTYDSPQVRLHSFLTARNGGFTRAGDNTFKCLSGWDRTANGNYSFGIYGTRIGSNAGVVTNIYGYRTSDTSTNPVTYHYYGFAQRNYYSPRTTATENVDFCTITFPLIA